MGRTITVGDVRIGAKEREYVNQVLDSGRLSYGPFSRQFEEMWAEKHGCKHAVFCNSGTSALHIALAALKIQHGWKDGDEVIVPSVTFVATANVVLHNNLKPVFVDVDPHTYNIDFEQIEAAITPRTRAIIPVHLTGLPAEMMQIKAIAIRHDLSVVEDSCETTFANCYGQKVGSWGDIGCFSTYMAHYIVTGVGGVATTNNRDLAVLMRSLMNHGRDSIYISIDDDNGLTGEKRKEVIARRFKFQHLGHSFRCTEMEAALGVAQLERSDEIVVRRQAIARKYTQGLRGLGDVLQTPYAPLGLEHVYMVYPLVVGHPPGSPYATRQETKVALVNHLEDNGIETRDLLPLLGQPVYEPLFGNLLPQFPVAQTLDRGGFYIGCHQYVDDADIEHVLDAFYSFFKRPRTAR